MQDRRYKDEGIRQEVKFGGEDDCDIVINFQETARF